MFQYADYIALLHEGTIKYYGEAKTIWDSDNPYIYQFIRGLTRGPIQSEIPHMKDKF
jgi:ABC-type transporter Mla maintaining outer membrane lipid asymmetry ATPase subunit MlaF